MQGQAGPGFSWLTFEPHIDGDKVSPKSSSSTNYTFTEEDEKKVTMLLFIEISWSIKQTKRFKLPINDDKLRGTWGKIGDAACTVACTGEGGIWGMINDAFVACTEGKIWVF